MRSTRRETKDTREIERATRDATETGQTRSRASSARRNGNGTCGKASENRVTHRNGTVGKNGREMRLERTMLADHSKTQANNLAVTPEQT